MTGVQVTGAILPKLMPASLAPELVVLVTLNRSPDLDPHGSL
jgi:hypothetical protein